jgi:hypothetical protein
MIAARRHHMAKLIALIISMVVGGTNDVVLNVIGGTNDD